MVHQKTVLLLVALACALGGGVNAVADFNRNINANSDGGDMASPWFYHGLEGPNFTTVSDGKLSPPSLHFVLVPPSVYRTATDVCPPPFDCTCTLSPPFLRLLSGQVQHP